MTCVSKCDVSVYHTIFSPLRSCVCRTEAAKRELKRQDPEARLLLARERYHTLAGVVLGLVPAAHKVQLVVIESMQ